MSPRLCSWLLATTLVLATGARVLAVPTGEIACGETETRALGSQPEELVFYAQPGEVIVASVRNPIHVLDAALMGADIVTVPYPVMERFLVHPLTDAGLEKFLAYWKKMGKA